MSINHNAPGSFAPSTFGSTRQHTPLLLILSPPHYSQPVYRLLLRPRRARVPLLIFSRSLRHRRRSVHAPRHQRVQPLRRRSPARRSLALILVHDPQQVVRDAKQRVHLLETHPFRLGDEAEGEEEAECARGAEEEPGVLKGPLCVSKECTRRGVQRQGSGGRTDEAHCAHHSKRRPRDHEVDQPLRCGRQSNVERAQPRCGNLGHVDPAAGAPAELEEAVKYRLGQLRLSDGRKVETKTYKTYRYMETMAT